MKKNNIFYFSLLFVCMACSSQEKTILDETRVDSLNIISVKCKNNIDNMTYLMGGVALKSEGLTVANYGQPKHSYVEKFTKKGQSLQWSVFVPNDGDGEYRISALIKANKGQKFKIELITSNKSISSINFNTTNNDWEKIDTGVLKLPKGTSTIKFSMTVDGDVHFKSLELIKESNLADYVKRVNTFKSDVSWFAKSKYGLMLQYGAWGYPQFGVKKSFENQTNDFNVPKFIKLVKESGASYVIWSMSWWTYQVSAPIHSIDAIIGNGDRTSSRDLIGEIATALHAEGINFMLYYHTGQDAHLGYNSTDWWKAQKWPEEFMETGVGNRDIFFKNWIEVINEIGKKYGTLLDGWFFDDGLIYYPAPFEKMGIAAKTGNANRLIAYNDWIITRYTEFQDMTFGEGQHGQVAIGSSPVGGDGVFTAGKSKGLLQHEMFMMEQDWGVHTANTNIETKTTISEARSWLHSSISRNVPLSFNLMMWEDGSVAKSSLDIMKTLKTEFIEK